MFNVQKVMVLAATNRPWDLDEALRRRLEKRIYVPLPDVAAREELFQLRLRGLSVSNDVSAAALAMETEGCSGADLHNLCREAAMAPMRRLLAEKSPLEIQQMRRECGSSAAAISSIPPVSVC